MRLNLASKRKKKDFIIVLVWSVAGFFLSLFIGGNYLISEVLLFVIPGVYLVVRQPSLLYKSTVFSLFFSVPTIAVVDYFAHLNGSWLNFSVIGLNVLNIFPIDDFLWGFLYVFYVVVFYEYFFDRDTHKRYISKRFFHTAAFFSLLVLLFVIIVSSLSQPLVIPYFYIIFSLLAFIIFPFIIFFTHRKITGHLLVFSGFFLFVSLLYEYVASVFGQWTFPGTEFIGFISVGGLNIPAEELIWILFAAPAVIAYYEIFADDKK